MIDKPKRLTFPLRTSHKHQTDLLEQKFIDLETTYNRLKLKPDFDEKYDQLFEQIEQLLDRPHCWDNANTIEQLLTPLYSDVELECEIELSLMDAKKRLSAASCHFFHQQYAKVEQRDGKLSLLCNLYKKLQISYDLEERKKSLLSGMRFAVCMAFLISIIMFFMFDNLRLLKLMMVIQSNHKFEFVVAAISAGWMGACFSMLLTLKGDLVTQSLAELVAISSIDNLIARSLIGMVSGLLIFFAFEATILQGALFPELDFNDVGKFIDKPNEWTLNKAHAMMVFWCFLAGFSEKMVPNLLAKAEERSAEGDPRNH